MSAQHNFSTANRPDLDWSQIRETVMMLNLAVAQIEYTMRDGDDSIDALSNSFTSIIETVETMARAGKSLPESEEKTTIMSNFEHVSDKVQTAIIAFQFYDKLTQRLNHVSNSLTTLTGLVSDQSRLYNPQEWQVLQTNIKSKYTLEADKKMFDDILQGKTIEEVLSNTKNMAEQNNEDDIELF